MRESWLSESLSHRAKCLYHRAPLINRESLQSSRIGGVLRQSRQSKSFILSFEIEWSGCVCSLARQFNPIAIAIKLFLVEIVNSSRTRLLKRASREFSVLKEEIKSCNDRIRVKKTHFQWTNFLVLWSSRVRWRESNFYISSTLSRGCDTPVSFWGKLVTLKYRKYIECEASLSLTANLYSYIVKPKNNYCEKYKSDEIKQESEGEKEKEAEKESCKVKELCQVSASLLVARSSPTLGAHWIWERAL